MGPKLMEEFAVEGNIYNINFPVDFSTQNTTETPREISHVPTVANKHRADDFAQTLKHRCASIAIALLLYWRVP